MKLKDGDFYDSQLRSWGNTVAVLSSGLRFE